MYGPSDRSRLMMVQDPALRVLRPFWLGYSNGRPYRASGKRFKSSGMLFKNCSITLTISAAIRYPGINMGAVLICWSCYGFEDVVHVGNLSQFGRLVAGCESFQVVSRELDVGGALH